MLICVIYAFYNCRVHDGGVYYDLLSFESFEKMIDWALDNKSNYEIRDIAEVHNGEFLKPTTKIKYIYDSYDCVGLEVYEFGFGGGLKIFKTIDRGDGKLTWKKIDE